MTYPTGPVMVSEDALLARFPWLREEDESQDRLRRRCEHEQTLDVLLALLDERATEASR